MGEVFNIKLRGSLIKESWVNDAGRQLWLAPKNGPIFDGAKTERNILQKFTGRIPFPYISQQLHLKFTDTRVSNNLVPLYELLFNFSGTEYIVDNSKNNWYLLDLIKAFENTQTDISLIYLKRGLIENLASYKSKYNNIDLPSLLRKIRRKDNLNESLYSFFKGKKVKVYYENFIIQPHQNLDLILNTMGIQIHDNPWVIDKPYIALSGNQKVRNTVTVRSFNEILSSLELKTKAEKVFSKEEIEWLESQLNL